MSRDEQAILEFLKQFESFISRKVIAKSVGGKVRFHKNPDWPLPILDRLVAEGVLEVDQYDHYRLKPDPKTKGQQKHSYTYAEKTYNLDDDQPFAAAAEVLRRRQNS